MTTQRSFAETLAYIQQHLNDDMEILAQEQQQLLRPTLPVGSTTMTSTSNSDGAALLPSDMVLQVLSVMDISLSSEERLRAIVDAAAVSGGGPHQMGGNNNNNNNTNSEADAQAVAEATLLMCEEVEEAQRRAQRRRGNGSSWRRCLKLVLTDGFTRIDAVEASGGQGASRPPLLPDGVALGAKLHIRDSNDGMYQHGVLRLHGGNTVVLGGFVPALQLFWEVRAKEQLVALSGKPAGPSIHEGSGNNINNSNNNSEDNRSAPSAVVQQQPHMEHAVPSAIATMHSNGNHQPMTVPMNDRDQPSSNAHAQPPFSSPVNLVASRNASNTSMQSYTNNNNNNNNNNNVTGSMAPPALPSPQPLSAWDRHYRTYYATTTAGSSAAAPPFVTRVVVTEVVSDLLINEVDNDDGSHNINNIDNEEEAAPSSLHCYYALVVSLAPAEDEEDANADAPSYQLQADLGHAWLSALVGVRPEIFRGMSVATDAPTQARLGAIVERVGQQLENLGIVTVALRVRRKDGMVEATRIS